MNIDRALIHADLFKKPQESAINQRHQRAILKSAKIAVGVKPAD